jgi:hypothetical protein
MFSRPAWDAHHNPLTPPRKSQSLPPSSILAHPRHYSTTYTLYDICELAIYRSLALAWAVLRCHSSSYLYDRLDSSYPPPLAQSAVPTAEKRHLAGYTRKRSVYRPRNDGSSASDGGRHAVHDHHDQYASAHEWRHTNLDNIKGWENERRITSRASASTARKDDGYSLERTTCRATRSFHG